MARFQTPVKCPTCGTPCWSTKQLNKFHNCVVPEGRAKKRVAEKDTTHADT